MPNTNQALFPFHYSQSTSQVLLQVASPSFRTDYKFENFCHPFVQELIQKLNQSESIFGVVDPVFLEGLGGAESSPPDTFFKIFKDYYEKPINENNINVEGFPKKIDLGVGGPYANYNWELFFHIPLTIAVHLSKNQRFAEAQRWFHLIFDPTNPDRSYWRFLAFREDGPRKNIEKLLKLLSTPENELGDQEREERREILAGYEAIRLKPFQPHAVARTRHLAYQLSVVMKYLDNLIAWGDSLFRQDTIESINEATQIYVLAANILGPKPQRIPTAGTVRPKTFRELKTQNNGLDAMGNALVELEAKFPFNMGVPTNRDTAVTRGTTPLFGIGRTLYFCVPRNDKLLGYWDMVADRLFKIRHCMNIEGIVRQLALFEPPLDPGMLVKAAAAGIDIGAAVNGLNQPIGSLRAPLMIQKALELSAEVRGLGNALLSVIEKGDGEKLALLRQSHEIRIQEMAQEVRFLQWRQAQESILSLLRGRSSALERHRYYQRLLGLPADQDAPDALTIEFASDPTIPPILTEENFNEAFANLIGQYDKALVIGPLPALQVAGRVSPVQQSGASSSGRLFLNNNEDSELNVHLQEARDSRNSAAVLSTLASVLTYIPEFDAKLAFWGLGAGSRVFGGSKMSDALKIASGIVSNTATREQDQAGMASRTGGHERRADEWLLQHNLSARELMQIGRQILGSLIAEQVAHHEYQNVKRQIEQSVALRETMEAKFSNEELYSWMQGELSRLYYEYYRFAFDTARKAEKTMKHELMRPEVDSTDYIKFNYWDGGRKGLLSGEALHLDLKRMEMAYHENNRREFELTKHVSLRQLNPLALLALKATGSCEVTIPEWLFDLDCPGHYMRRIKSVSVSIPSIVGPYTSLTCTLSLLKSSLRKSPIAGDDYARQGSEDDRFVDYIGAVQSIVTSSGQNDSGLFETNLRDERFLPFEGAGAESTWKFDLPKDYCAFDYQTISDVVLHIRYTARSGVEATKVKVALDEVLRQARKSDLALVFSLRHDFPSEWAAFVSGDGNFSTTIRSNHFPYLVQRMLQPPRSKNISVVGLEVYEGIKLTHRRADAPSASVESPVVLSAEGQLSLTINEDNVVKRTSDVEVFLILRYAIQ